MKIRFIRVFALTRMAPIHRVSYCIQPYLNCFKRFVGSVQFRFILDNNENILSISSTIGLRERVASWKSKLPQRNRRNENYVWLAEKYDISCLCWYSLWGKTILSQRVTKLCENFFWYEMLSFYIEREIQIIKAISFILLALIYGYML